MRHLPPLFLLAAALLGTLRPACAQEATVRKLRVGVLPGLHYDTPRFAVSPGEAIELRFVNGDEMPHNFVLTKPGQRLTVVNAALALGADGPGLGWVPEREDILHAIAELGPGKEQTLSFTAPTERGVYPYVCTYPGHGFLMFGAMYVGTPMPAKIADDENCSPGWRSGLLEAPEGGHEHHHEPPARPSLHAWSADRRPLVYRVFMPDCSPAAFAVALPGDLSYCWDGTACRLRYAWHGGFVDPMPVWKGNGNGLAEVLGERFVAASDRPFDLPALADEAGDLPAPSLLGHRRQDGLPEFHYRLGKVEVRSMIRALPSGAGLTIDYALRTAKEDRALLDGLRVTPRFDGAIKATAGAILTDDGGTRRFTVTLTRRTAEDDR